MSVVSVKEVWNGRDGDHDISGERTYSKVYIVTTDSKYDDFATVSSSASLPRRGDNHPSDFDAYCQKVTGTQASFSPTVWNVTAAYSNKREASDDPTEDAAEYEWSTEQFQRPAFKDKDGNAIVNSAGDPYLPGLDQDDSRRVVTITKNYQNVPSWVQDMQDAVNSSAITIDGLTIGARKAKVQSVTVGKRFTRNDIEYRTVTIAIHLRRETWDYEVMDTGMRKIDGSDRVVITNDDGTEITAPVALDGAGDVLADPDSSTVVYNTHRVYYETDISSIIPS